MEQVTCIVIDQIRDNLNSAMKMPWQIASEEKTIGTFGNMRAATNIKSLQHAVRQWIYLSKGETFLLTDPMGIDGWSINLSTIKNKLAPSQYSVPVVFDKKFGIHPLWSEFWFLANKTKTENKLYPKEKKMPYPLLITGTPTKRILDVINPQDGTSMYKAEFSEKKFIEKYNTDENFKQWFDYAINISCEMRIRQGMFRTVNPNTGENQINENDVTQHIDPNTGEVSYMDSNGDLVDVGQQINISSVNS